MAEVRAELDPVLRFPEVKKLTGLSRSGVYGQMNRQEFPRAIPLGGRAIGWLQSEILAWRQAHIDRRDAQLHSKGT